MVDEATVARSVESPPMKAYEHLQAWQAHEPVLERITATLKALREEVGLEPRNLDESRAIVERLGAEASPRFQLYLPDLGVAGEGRCICEASLEALHAFEVLLESAYEHKDWRVLPAPDRSVRTAIAALRTEFYFWLWRFLERRIPSDEARSCRRVKTALAAAVA